MFMVKRLFIFVATLALVACSTQSKLCDTGPNNLIQNSEFAIVTPNLDTLFLCSDEFMGIYLAQCWREGKFKEHQAVVLLLDCDKFEKITQRVRVVATSDLVAK
jgi:uncharacterized lipoprotein YajG